MVRECKSDVIEELLRGLQNGEQFQWDKQNHSAFVIVIQCCRL
jgi:hypothetical protein